MIWIDFVIIGAVCLALLKGVLQGAVREIFAILIWIMAYVIALNFSIEFSLFLEPYIQSASLRLAVSFIFMMAITLVFGTLIGCLLGEVVKKTHLTLVDRLGGMVFGVMHGLLIVVGVVMLSGLTALPEELWWQESRLLPPLQLFSSWLRGIIPSDLLEFIRYRR